ncbi:amidase enhancer [Gottschalkia acidurici 9a]|uniref:Amidase enhancer n=1 Tax=Gottschalkia acidurici (strain ATCC 7906 / DSM 604 / BCRC 14475 / CIP 104303 / KCTC 5404 / NCIMB 10678 / 9a) TaxID=1128398 RepID=K0AZ50_GOTA9|nr:SpoIID/LytB domain-containing protein [Gottschalkia acidurici]AFS78072.1 amidase enhancer [Gottschalkia acidurici 9a]
MRYRKGMSLLIALSLILLNVLIPVEIKAYGENYDSKYIKVGLTSELSSKSTINLSGNSFSVVKGDNSFRELLEINTGKIVAKSKNFGYHIQLSDNYYSYDSALSKANELKNLGIDASVAYDNGFRVWIGEFSDESSASTFMNSIVGLTSDYMEVSKNDSIVSIEETNGRKIISFDKNQNICIKSTDNIISVESKKYRDYITFVNNNGKLITINYIELGSYLKGVVPREMSGSWELEALKAQAVSARNFTLLSLNKHKDLGFDICDTTHCQVYGGYNVEHPNSNRAVDETRDKVLKYNGEIASTFYYSCSGGYTANNEDVWSGTPIPYLRAKEDIFSTNTPHSNWLYTITKQDASQALRSNGFDVGEIISIETRRDSHGVRVVDFIVTGTKGSKTVSKEKVRAIFGYNNVKSTNYVIDDSGSTTPVDPGQTVDPSSNGEIYILSQGSVYPTKSNIDNLSLISRYTTEKINSNSMNIVVSDGKSYNTIAYNTNNNSSNSGTTNNSTSIVGDKITFNGKGWGHGIGMSQYGALNMAKAGYLYTDILEFYYTGAKVE